MAKRSTSYKIDIKKKHKKNGSNGKVTRYTHEHIKKTGVPETGHTPLMPANEQTVTLPMDNGWTDAIKVGRLENGNGHPVVLDMDPAVDPVLFWAGKRNQREIPVLPLQRNEIVSESRIAQIIERAKEAAYEKSGQSRQGHLFADLEKALRESEKGKRVEFYTHEEGWKNKLICGDSLQVMESLLHYEGLAGKVQMIYIDPPYGIKYNSNFQQRIDSTQNDEKDQADDVLTIKAFRDTWALGIHSYLSYLQERLYLCRDLLTSNGSVFVQINDENVHRVRSLMDEVFGASNFISQIVYQKTPYATSQYLPPVYDTILFYAKDKTNLKYCELFREKASAVNLDAYSYIESPDGKSFRSLTREEMQTPSLIPAGWQRFQSVSLVSPGSASTLQEFEFGGKIYEPPANSHWKTSVENLKRVARANRIFVAGNTPRFKSFMTDFPISISHNIWTDTITGGFADEKLYVVQTLAKVIKRCLLMSTEPGDIVLDITCGSGTTAFVAEQWGRRWITCDTSRVAINIARQRLLAGVFDHYKTRNGHVSSGFQYKTVNRITLKSIANNLEPEKVELVDQPEVDKTAIRVTGPFEVMTLGRYSPEDWKGYLTESGKLENYITVICRLYRKDVSLQGASGLVHAIAESENEKIALSIGPLTGRVTARQINDAVQDALALGVPEIHILGWAFEANVGEGKSQLEAREKVKVELIMIRPDTLAEGLKVTQPEMLFSPLALPDIEVKIKNGNGKEKEAVVTLKGVGVFDRKRRTTNYYPANKGYVAAWYLDEDYDGDCFVDCQMFFDFKKKPNLKAALKAEVDSDEFELQLASRPFPPGVYKRIAVKVVDVYGNESTVVKNL